MAASNRELDAASLTPNPQAAGGRARVGAVRTLRLLLIGSAVLPLLLGSIAGYYSYRADYHRAAVALSEAATVAEENTTKILDTHLMAAGRISMEHAITRRFPLAGLVDAIDETKARGNGKILVKPQL